MTRRHLTRLCQDFFRALLTLPINAAYPKLYRIIHTIQSTALHMHRGQVVDESRLHTFLASALAELANDHERFPVFLFPRPYLLLLQPTGYVNIIYNLGA